MRKCIDRPRKRQLGIMTSFLHTREPTVAPYPAPVKRKVTCLFEPTPHEIYQRLYILLFPDRCFWIWVLQTLQLAVRISTSSLLRLSHIRAGFLPTGLLSEAQGTAPPPTIDSELPSPDDIFGASSSKIPSHATPIPLVGTTSSRFSIKATDFNGKSFYIRKKPKTTERNVSGISN